MRLSKIAGGIAFVIVVFVVTGLARKAFAPAPQPQAQREQEEAAYRAEKSAQLVKARAAERAFRMTLRVLDPDRALVADAAVDEEQPIVMRVLVTPAFEEMPHARRMRAVESLLEGWRTAFKDSDVPPLLKLLTPGGREVGGTRTFGGVWVEE